MFKKNFFQHDRFLRSKSPGFAHISHSQPAFWNRWILTVPSREFGGSHVILPCRVSSYHLAPPLLPNSPDPHDLRWEYGEALRCPTLIDIMRFCFNKSRIVQVIVNIWIQSKTYKKNTDFHYLVLMSKRILESSVPSRTCDPLTLPPKTFEVLQRNLTLRLQSSDTVIYLYLFHQAPCPSKKIRKESGDQSISKARRLQSSRSAHLLVMASARGWHWSWGFQDF